ncbi:MAG: right-handed parallel beta-helix repeat-containing protein [Lachnospiraceae bacterium]
MENNSKYVRNLVRNHVGNHAGSHFSDSFRKITALLLALILAAPILLHAPRVQARVVTVTVNVTNASSAESLIQKKINAAAAKAKDTVRYTVKISPAGTYNISKGLTLYSNVTLDLNKSVLKRTGSSINMIRIGAKADNKAASGKTGYAYKNISVINGVLDGGKKAKAIFKGAHAKNIKLTDLTFRNVADGHMVEAAGISGLTISRCIFKNQTVSSSGDHFRESIQIDILEETHFSEYRVQVLPTKNVKILNCTFKNVPRGIGSSSSILNKPNSNITIQGCKFDTTTSTAIYAIGWQDVTIADNIIKNCPRAICLYPIRKNCSGTYRASYLASKGGVKSSVSNAFNPYTMNAAITGNTISVTDKADPYSDTGAANLAIEIKGFNISSNTSLSNGSYVPKGNYRPSGITINGNTITVPGHGIRVENAVPDQIDNNQIDCTISSGNYFGIAGDNLVMDSISGNTINGTPSNSIHISGGSTIGKVSGNIVSDTGKYAVNVNSSRVEHLDDNMIAMNGSYGIVLKSSTIGYASGNTIKGSYSRLFNTTGCIEHLGENYEQ